MRAHSRSIQKTKGDNVNLKAVYKTTVDITSLETTNMNAAINGRQKLQRNQNEEVIASLQSETANVFLVSRQLLFRSWEFSSPPAPYSYTNILHLRTIFFKNTYFSSIYGNYWLNMS